MNSGFFSLNLNDLLKGVIVAFLAVLVTSISVFVDAGNLPTWVEFLSNLKTAGIAAFSYLLKQLLTGVSGVFLKK